MPTGVVFYERAMDLQQLASDLWTDARLFAMNSEDRMSSDKNVAKIQRKLQLVIDAGVQLAVKQRHLEITTAAEEFLFRKRKLLMSEITEKTKMLGDVERKLKAVNQELAGKREVVRKRNKRNDELKQEAASMGKKLDVVAKLRPVVHKPTRRTEPIVHKRSSQTLARELDELEAKQ